ncbi:uncharacterized protein LOC124404257 [Diprion similis]|uniref:uncharacterized protein LOC124404257 n=1 Tax=Diprion similis TaxID=362088 RepID=UPI001EF9508E|nr:uncharacterized protein LOC124404257 [Diprion similis]XP_046734196.1 uncharacterized protein LOC124404257 [Diprion similis]XP_046734198.1 uncharacterized protein LOC124404257 [Diprion similis]
MGFVSIFLFTVMAFVNLPGINSDSNFCPEKVCIHQDDCMLSRPDHRCQTKDYVCCILLTNVTTYQVAACTDQGGVCIVPDECMASMIAKKELAHICPVENDVCCILAD